MFLLFNLWYKAFFMVSMAAFLYRKPSVSAVSILKNKNYYMAKNNIEESQQQSQGVALGTQGNQDIGIPQGTKGSHRPKKGEEDRSIPNQDRSSASNQKGKESGRGQE